MGIKILGRMLDDIVNFWIVRLVHGPRPKFSHIGTIWVGKTW